MRRIGLIKKIIINILIILFLVLPLFAEKDPLNIQALKSEIKKEAEKSFEPVIDIMSTGLNTGIYAPVSGKIISAGIQANVIIVKKEGLLKDADIPVVLFPFAFIGLRAPVFGVNIFARGMVFPYQDKTIKIIGIGGGWEPDFIPIFTTKLIIQYHFLKNFPFIEGNSFGGTMIVAFDKIPFICPFVIFGLNNTSLATPDIQVLDETINFSMNKTKFQLGAGIKLLNIITLEAGIIPVWTGSISLGLSF